MAASRPGVAWPLGGLSGGRPKGSELLINSLLRTQWQFVSDWFGLKMEESVEPKLNEILPPLLRGALGDKFEQFVSGPGGLVSMPKTGCSLGDTPARIGNVNICKTRETLAETGDSIDNVQIVGELDWFGSSTAGIVLKFPNVDLEAIVTKLHVKGKVVIELVRLTAEPPWFSGIRIFFPSAPELELVLNVNWNSKSCQKIPLARELQQVMQQVVKEVLADRTDSVITSQAVMPNRFSLPLGDRISDFHLQDTLPEGVLRVKVKNAERLRSNRRLSFRNCWLCGCIVGSAEDARPCAEVSVGGESFRTQAVRTLEPAWDEVHDIIVYDSRKQIMQVAIRDTAYGPRQRLHKSTDLLGLARVAVRELVEPLASGEVRSGRRTQERTGFRETSLGGRACVELETQWRPLATGGQSEGRGTWKLGGDQGSQHLLIVNLFHASGLVEAEDTEYWADVKVSGCWLNGPAIKAWDQDEAMCQWLRQQGSHAPMASPSRNGKSSRRHGDEVLRQLGISTELLQQVDGDVRNVVPRSLWRQRVPVGSAAEDCLDVVWNHSWRVPIDRYDHPDAAVTITVYTALDTRLKKASDTEVGAKLFVLPGISEKNDNYRLACDGKLVLVKAIDIRKDTVTVECSECLVPSQAGDITFAARELAKEIKTVGSVRREVRGCVEQPQCAALSCPGGGADIGELKFQVRRIPLSETPRLQQSAAAPLPSPSEPQGWSSTSARLSSIFRRSSEGTSSQPLPGNGLLRRDTSFFDCEENPDSVQEDVVGRRNCAVQ